MSERDDVPELTDEERVLVTTLRAMPREGSEPDWNQLAQRISASLPAELPRGWWWRITSVLRQPRWLVPLLATAVAAGAFAVIALRHDDHAPARDLAMLHDAGVDATSDERRDADDSDENDLASADSVLLWLDGAEVAVDQAAAEALDVDDLLLGESTERPEGLLTTDDSWVDNLDDADVAALDQWLDQQPPKKNKKG